MLAQNWGENGDITVDDLNKVLVSYDLPPYWSELFDDVMGTFYPPEGFDFENKKSPISRAFMEKEKILVLWEAKGDDDRVMEEIVEGPALLKHDIHMLLMGGIPPDVIADKLNGKHTLTRPINTRMVEVYTHYFWNKDRVPLTAWDKILCGYPRGDVFLTVLYCGPQQALYRCGMQPKVDVTRAIKEVHRQAYFRLEALRYSHDSHKTTQTFSALAAKVMASHEIMTAQGAGLQDQLKQFRQIMMKHNDPDIKQVDTLINKLEGGSYSGEVKAVESGEKNGD
jgi:hypothetical protein